jgi:hypothetical protein
MSVAGGEVVAVARQPRKRYGGIRSVATGFERNDEQYAFRRVFDILTKLVSK